MSTRSKYILQLALARSGNRNVCETTQPVPAIASICSRQSSPAPSLPKDTPSIFDSEDSTTDKDFSSDDSARDKDFVPDFRECQSDGDMMEAVSSRSVPANEDTNIANMENQGNTNLATNNVKKWARAIRKKKSNQLHSGQSYVNVSGKVVKARALQSLKQCRKKCSSFLTEDLRKKIFNEYWSLGSHNKRVTFIANLITSKAKLVTRKRKPDSLKERAVTHEYFFECNGKRVSVCKDCFCKTLDERPKFIAASIRNKSFNTSGITTDDKRGKNVTANKKTEQEINEVRAHIQSFPSYESHYTRRTNDKRYLPSHLNLRIMYDLYKEGCNTPVGRTLYEREFHELKLAFKKPHIDTCFKCDTLQMRLQVATNTGDHEGKHDAENDIKTHQEQANTAYEAKRLDKIKARNNLSTKCFSFDLQQCLPTPFIGSSVAFYKRQLWTYNLTVHDNASGESMNYMWHEGQAARGGNEIASCLYQQLKSLPNTVSEVTFYSDTCGGQNKNSHVAAMFIFAQTELPHLTINHKFLVPGHTHMECDIDHSMIEKQKKKMPTPVYHPHDWYQLVRSTGKKKQFRVHEMQQEEFLDFSGLLKTALVSRKKNEDGEQFSWHSVQWLQYKEMGLIRYKTSLNDSEDFKVLNFIRRGKFKNLKDSLKRKYFDLNPISAEKKRDLCSLLILVPPVLHEFYKNLVTSKEAAEDDPDLFDEEDDQT